MVYLSKLPCVHTCSLLAATESATFSEPAHLSIYTYSLSSKKHLTCFTTFYLSVETDFCTADGPRALLLAPGGIVARIQVFLYCCSTSISGQKLKSSLEPLQVEARGDHYQLVPAYYTASPSSFHLVPYTLCFSQAELLVVPSIYQAYSIPSLNFPYPVSLSGTFLHVY